MQNLVWDRLRQARLTIDQTATLLELSRAEIETFYIPLARFLLERRQVLQRRILAAVAGPPGVGKTAFTTLLVAVINAEADQQDSDRQEMGQTVAVQIQQDGWHYSNSYLATHAIQRVNEEISLSQIKGAPESFDAESSYACLEKIRRGQPVSYPVYSRALHNPVADAGKVEPYHQVVVVEGNYLFLQKAPWEQFLSLFDTRIFLMAPRDSLVEGLRQRHVRGGKSSAAAERQIREVDLPNINQVLENSASAGVVVYKTDYRHIARVEYEDI